MEKKRRTRRMAGFLRARQADLGLSQVPDPRDRRGRRWRSMAPLLRHTLLALMSGCKSGGRL